MRFKFCGGLDCPDWLLTQIALLSKLSSVKVKLICNEVVADVVESNVNFEKLKKLTSDAKFDEEDVKGTFAALSFILKSSVKHSVDANVLSNELQQLGFPKEHASSISKVFSDKLDALKSALRRQSLKLNTFDDLHWKIVSELSNDTHKVTLPMLSITLNTTENATKRSETFMVTEEKLNLLIQELKQLESLM